ncbi:winged helix-turn-helix domain-containing protein [Paracoccus benzoatiresistens]|uniref:Winged helix-turn-helix domain-containing protein n=1 Tax=Paracoccus benzoatiresistens TaxID=2997341 RepID=A0ABT4J1D7_9RHOB|nr:winged helix-turn-helix domain-containing protein [Paracoccus sp. EF6]MCZ0960937.1 winged helix-turn-helix domain-containing protein [Paracoccus sp. EF6]
MIYGFGDHELDDQRFELRRNGRSIPVEPQVFLVLRELLRAGGRLVGKEQLADVVWGGAVSDASIASRVRAARAALGDDGERQAVIRTVHGRGFRLMQPVRAAPQGGPALAAPSLAVLPFGAIGLPRDRAILTEALAHEILRALSRLRWLVVISRGSSFRFARAGADLSAIGARLGVRYLLTGTVELSGNTLAVSPELVEAESARILWTDRLSEPLDRLAELQQTIVSALCTALELHLPLNEARLAEGRDIESLDAWASYHLGLRQMFHFTAEGNRQAAACFDRAIRLDPGFARAHAGLSFTSFQDAFLRYGPDRDRATDAARAHAERSLELDPLDPFAALTLGRSYWLTDQVEVGAGWLARATDLNPNYAQGFYGRAILAAILARPEQADEGVDRALQLSPLDPLLYGMFGTRALRLLQGEDPEGAADWADRAASAPHAHFLIGMIAMAANGLAGRDDQAGTWGRHVRALRPDASRELFFTAFPLRDDRARGRIGGELARQGFG